MPGGKPSKATGRSLHLTSRNEVGHAILGNTVSNIEEGKYGTCLSKGVVCFVRDKA